MNTVDEWGQDPTVKRTRTYFARMEAMDAAWIKRSGISAFDPRLRKARELRFALFENAGRRAARQGMRAEEDLLITLFAMCQDTAFKKCGLPILSTDQEYPSHLLDLVKDGLP